MPWTRRPRRRRLGSGLRRALRRWRREHSEDLPSLWIGAVVIAATLLALKLLKFL